MPVDGWTAIAFIPWEVWHAKTEWFFLVSQTLTSPPVLNIKKKYSNKDHLLNLNSKEHIKERYT